VIIGSRVGLHARPAALFVQAAARQQAKVTIARGDRGPVDARSILGVLSLDARGGDEVVLAAEGDGAERSLDELSALLASDLDAPLRTTSGLPTRHTPGSWPAGTRAD
jgi:phosphocarrier protein